MSVNERVTGLLRRPRNRLGRIVRGMREALLDVAARGAAARRPARGPADPPHLLMIDELVPDPRYGAGYPRARKLLETIRDAGWAVTFYPMIASAEETARMRASGLDGVDFLESGGRRGLLRLVRSGVGRFDAALVSRPDTVAAFRSACAAVPAFASSTRCIFDAEALFAPRERRRRALFGEPFSEQAYTEALDAELSLLRDADAITAVSPADAAVFHANAEAPVHVVAHRIVAAPTTAGFAERCDLLFVGRLEGPRDASPNVDSIVWFVREVMPLLDRRLGTNYRLQVVGVVGSADVRALASDRVVLHGVVDDLATLYGRCRVFIAPTRFAAGIPLKVLEAFGFGVPCVVTPLLAEQIAIDDGEALIGETPAAFADACATLYESADRWKAAREAALRKLEREYSSEAFDDSVRAMLASVSGPRAAR